MSTPLKTQLKRQGVTHPVNVSYLVVGLVFLGIAASWALRQVGVLDADDLGLVLPLLLVVAGGIGLVAFAARGLSRHRGDGTDQHVQDPDEAAEIARLESVAFAPYHRDQERTQILRDSEASLDSPATEKPDTDKDENR